MRVEFDNVTAAADADARTITGTILRWDTPGRTSAGLMSVPRGVLTLPEDPGRVKLTTDHDRDALVGRATALEDTATELRGTFAVAATPEGDRALLEAREGLRDGLSVDLDGVRVGTGGRCVAGTLRAVGQVAWPAFTDSRLVASDHPPTGDQPPERPTMADSTASAPAHSDPPGSPGGDGSPARVTAETSSRGRATGVESVESMARLVADVNARRRPREELQAALADITWTDHGGKGPAQWVGELWDSGQYERPLIDSLRKGPAPSAMNVSGWRWVTRPEVGIYGGDKADIPSGPTAIDVVAEPVVRYAGGHDIDRAHFDLDDHGYVKAHMEAMREDYLAKTETGAVSMVAAQATVAAGDQSTAVNAIIAAALTCKPRPTFLAVAPDVYAALATESDPAVLAGLGITVSLSAGPSASGLRTFLSADLDPGQVLAGNQSAVTWHEQAPFQVEAQQLGQGGVDVALFGYACCFVHDTSGLALATVAAG